jgi:hypothetical protein
MLFVNMQGYKVWVVVEADIPGSSAPPPPPKPLDDKEDELEDSDEEDWDGRRGKHDQKKEKKVQSAPLEGKSGRSKQKAAALALVPYSQVPSLPSALLGTIPSIALNQYGSNLTVSWDIFPTIAKIITVGRLSSRPCDQIVSADDENPPVS